MNGARGCGQVGARAGGMTPEFAARVIRWQKRHGRHDLPWQNTREPYRIWLAEVMLQQTQVATVMPYYQRFLGRFPDIDTLGRAPLDDVLEMWSGLGYYSRARNLHRAALTIVKEHAGRFPCAFDAVLALPGIGRSTAAAICVFAYGARHAILDGNVRRVFARYSGIEGHAGHAATLARLWQTGEQALPEHAVEAYTQGLMDLGSGVCTRARPKCELCPLEGECFARASGRIAELPAPRPRKSLPRRSTRMLVLLNDGEVLLEKRPNAGVWGGLWSLPEVETGAQVSVVCGQRYGVQIAAAVAMPPIAHAFTHFKLTIEPHRIEVARVALYAAHPGVVWLPLAQALNAAIPAPVRRILSAIS